MVTDRLAATQPHIQKDVMHCALSFGYFKLQQQMLKAEPECIN